MIHHDTIIITGIIVALLCVAGWWRYRGQTVPMSATMLLMRAGGALAISMFYQGVKMGAGNLAEISRFLFMFILLATAVTAIAVLILKQGKWHGR